MPDCKRLVSTLGLRHALALVALMLVAPVPLSVLVTVSSRPDCPRASLTLPPAPPVTCLSAAMTTDDVAKVKAISSENEEEEEGADALDAARESFLTPSSFRKVPERPLIAPRSILALYPLRC